MGHSDAVLAMFVTGFWKGLGYVYLKESSELLNMQLIAAHREWFISCSAPGMPSMRAKQKELFGKGFGITYISLKMGKLDPQ